MPSPIRSFSLAIGVFVALSTASGLTQGPQDPHLPPPQTLPALNEVIQIVDMLLSPEQYEQLTTPPVSHRQANMFALGQRQFYWEWGVVPYEMAPNFSEAEQQRIRAAMEVWGRTAPITFVQRTTQTGFLAVTRDEVADPQTASPCFAAVGHRLGAMSRINLGATCSSSSSTILHELGHVLGFYHEHQRLDRDTYVSIDIGNVAGNARFAFDRYNFPVFGVYDFGSIMHYGSRYFALDISRPTIIPKPGYEAVGAQMGAAQTPSANDLNMMAVLYFSQMGESAIRTPTEPQRSRFDRGDMLLAMERLHGFYMSRMGLQRPEGLSINGRPDFLGIAQWIFDIYLPARSAGFSSQGAFDIVVAAITRTDEWRSKNPGRTALTPAAFRPAVSFSRDEFLDVLNRLDRFYSAPEGLQRPNGLSISGGPDFLGIATWIFDIYLAERLNGISPNGAWTITENAIRATNEWRSKH
jgi:hypothetical protein